MKIKTVLDKQNIQQYFSLKEIKTIFILLAPYIKKHKGVYVGLFLLLFIETGLTLSSAWFIGAIMDAAVQHEFAQLKWLVAIGIGLSVLHIIINFTHTYLDTVAMNAVEKELELDLYKHILLMSGKNFSAMHSGELLSHFTNDISYIHGVAGSGLLNLVRLPIISISAFIYLVQINWKLSFFVLAIAPLAVAGGAVFGLLLRNNSRMIHDLHSSMAKSLAETFQGFTVIRSFTLEGLFFKKYAEKNEQLYALELKDAKLRGWFGAGGQAVATASFLTSLLVGTYFVTDDVLTIGALVTFINLVNHLISPLTGLAGQWAGYQHSISAMERLTRVFKQPTESKELPYYSSSGQTSKEIRFQNLTFSYDGVHSVFQNVELHIPAGQTTAIVGPSGAGKSTLFNLLQCFYRPDAGTILIDGVSIDQLAASQLRNMIACVPQETFLFSGTIRENLLLARPGITEEEMIQGAMDANIHDFIASLPAGYDTEIGERGVRLSGGQKQRITIARALLKDAPILLLDEATSALDSESEYLVKEALDRLMKGRTTLIIAHRFSTIQHADAIVVMNNGEIVQMGSHKELISKEGLYQTLNHKQFFRKPAEPEPLFY